MITEFRVAGLTCGHCARAITEEVGRLAAVSAVEVELVPGGVSVVRAVSDEVPQAAQIVAALTKAGDYQLVGIASAAREPGTS